MFDPIRKLWLVLALGLSMPMLNSCSSYLEEAAEAGLRAQQLLDAKDLYGAKEAITEALAARDDDPDLHILKGRIDLASGRPRDAFQAYSDALSLEATNPEALQAVSQLGLQTGFLREAESAADTILSFSPDQPDALLTKGLIALVKKKYDDAQRYSERILAVRPGSEAGLIIQARTLALSGETEQGRDLLLDATSEVGFTEGIDLTLIELYRELRDLPAMLATFERLRRKRPDDHSLSIDYINTLYKSGDPEKARRATDRLLRADVKNTETLKALTNLWLEYDAQPFNAVTRDFLAKDGSLEARVAIARYLLALDRPEDARRILVSVASGFWPETRALYARAIYQLGDTAEGVKIANELLEEDTTNGDALLVRIQESIREQDYVQAKNDAQLVVRDNPLLRAGYFALIDVYLAADNEAGAQRIFRDAAQKLPQDLILFRRYGDFLMSRGESVRAILATRRFARDTSASLSAWELLTDMCKRADNQVCIKQAGQMAEDAQTIYAIDPPPGTPPTRGLFGRLG
ncbi:Tfp pilus assembly protein PilF [Parasphingorhabdus marina DSM 22363]|uniref:Tfp pilus assembly protein PilF n=1 Tax=Parasphingorhabdus marina DSM 22363 TaxID=1123272 RepID=A0A1N6CPS7_9SPHN|nr:tetratricopeptide repeat protein [Parasphingorhabdus marina]SIN60459.1 Tfp pilus assembly protein PilF [Parasphingorhabdus marina DSM 22363]